MGWKLSIVGKDEIKGKMGNMKIDPVDVQKEYNTVEELLIFLDGFLKGADLDLVREIVISKVH